MSVIYLTKHNENIYNVIKAPIPKTIKPPRYISSFNKRVKKEVALKKNKEKHGTMGPPEISLEDPKKFLKKHTGKTSKELGAPVKPNLTNIETVIPKQINIKRKKTKPDYIRKNIVGVKNVNFQEPPPKTVITRYGDTALADIDGIKKFLTLPKFGKAPEYLVRRMRVAEFQEKLEQDVAEIACLPKCRYVTRQEREDLLNGLKKNWEELQKEFQLLPMITDTIPKINRKIKLEKDLLELEKDITLIEKHPYIYIDEISKRDK